MYMAPQNVPNAIVLTLGNKVALHYVNYHDAQFPTEDVWDRNSAQHLKTHVNTEKLLVFSHSSDIHSRYSQTVIFHHITNEIFSNQWTITMMHQEVVFSHGFVKKAKFCLQKFEIKNENFDCEVYTKPFAKIVTPQRMGKQPCSDHDDQLEVLHLAYHST